MAFQAGITVNQVSIAGGCALNIVDTSNYDASNYPPDPFHTRSDFNKKRVVVTNQDSIQYTMDSVELPPIVDESILKPSFGSSADTVQYDFNGNDANGSYLIELFTVPTFEKDLAFSYSVDDDHVVYYNGLIYRATVNGVSDYPSTLIGWEVVDYDYLRTTTKYYDSATVVVNCLEEDTYQTSLYNIVDRTYSIVGAGDCSGFVITDESNYASNTEGGHNITDFSDYRVITIDRPSGGVYVMSSVPGMTANEVISAPSSGNQTFTYNFLTDDVDGLYTVTCCSIPTWRDTAAYVTNAASTLVYYNGVLYRALRNNTGAQPDVSTSDWAVFDNSADQDLLTRYCYEAKYLVLCISLLRCRASKIVEAACLIRDNFCNDDVLCRNKKFLAFVKLQVLFAIVQLSMDKHAWNEVEADINLMKQICNC